LSICDARRTSGIRRDCAGRSPYRARRSLVHGAEGPLGRVRVPERGFRHRKNKLAQLGGDQFMGVINSVNKLLTTEGMTTMNKAVAIDKQDEATVAKQFLQANNLV
jgi:hypothetical protein